MTEQVAINTRYTGIVKRFDNGKGFGFITALDGPRATTDLFVHHTAVNVTDTKLYKSLVPGEYVSFEVIDLVGKPHPFCAGNVKGILGGKLMCETKHEHNLRRLEYEAKSKARVDEQVVQKNRQVRTKRVDNKKKKE